MKKNNLLFLLAGLLLTTFSTVAQQNGDIDLLTSVNFKNPKYELSRKVDFGITNNPRFITKYNPITLAFSTLMYTYQKFLSVQVSASCLYNPSCSEYSRLLFHEFGFWEGLITTSDRLMRCDRISATSIQSMHINEKDGKVHENVIRYRLR
jgi:uncharacterized protein